MAIIVVRVIIATKISGLVVIVSVPLIPKKLSMAKGMMTIPIRATITPITSGGKRKRIRLINRDNTDSVMPAKAVIPNSSDSPPVLTAKIEAVR